MPAWASISKPMDPREQKVLGRLQRLCARAEYCTADIRRKALAALEGDTEAADRIVASLLQDRFVDDARYAAAFAREKAALQGWGPLKIRFQLRGKRVAEDVIDQALAELDPAPAEARLQKLAAEKDRSLQGDPQRRLKLIKYLLSRGYDYSAVAPVVEQL